MVHAATLWAILLVMVGCGLNNLSLEFIIRYEALIYSMLPSI